MAPRKAKDWDPLESPSLLVVTGHRDTTTKVTYLPFADHEIGVMGWEIIPHLGKGFLVYMSPVIGEYKCQIKVHSTLVEPDPSTDLVIGTVDLPPELFDRMNRSGD